MFFNIILDIRKIVDVICSINNQALLKAIIYKSTGSWYSAKDDSGVFWQCRIKGKLKIDTDITSTNPISVGDEVLMEVEDEEKNWATITTINKRKNYVIRVSPHNLKRKHIIAANIDQAIVIASIVQPKTSLGFIDRFLVATAAYHIPTIIVWNKKDIWTTEDQDVADYFSALYQKIGYTTLQTSILNQDGIEELKLILQNKTSLLSGHSGVGKSSLINTLFPEMNLRTSQVSDSSGKGLHTTTFSEMFDLATGGSIIDTPGIRELGIVDISREELGGYYTEIKQFAAQCKYNNCVHLNEPQCAVLEAVKNSEISEERLHSYYNIMESISTKNY
jgi:ribosome biogenesis GTPase / thiamine phosphate phosphatase